MNYRLWWATIYVSDMDQAVEFYRDTLGMQVRFVDKEYASFRAGPGMVELTLGPGPVGVNTGIGLGVKDLDVAFAELEAKGVKFVQPQTKKPWGDYDAIIADPDGNQLILDHMSNELSEDYLDGKPAESSGE